MNQNAQPPVLYEEILHAIAMDAHAGGLNQARFHLAALIILTTRLRAVAIRPIPALPRNLATESPGDHE